MAPIFPPRSNTIARVSILVILILLAVIVGILVWWVHSSAFNKVGVQVPQPVPFPHSFHVSVLGLNCRYCHDSVDKAAFADLPPAETCMSCHSQVATTSPVLSPIRDSYQSGRPVQWNRVNALPDYVYFDHHIHIAKGVGCESCHGRVDQMTTDVKANTFYMAWCLKCHTHPQNYLRPKENVYDMGYQPTEAQAVVGVRLVKEYNVLPPLQMINCSLCHR